MSTKDTKKDKKKPGPKKGDRNRLGKITDEIITEFVCTFIEKNGRVPRNRDIVDGTGMTKSNVSKRLAKFPDSLTIIKGLPAAISWPAMVTKVFNDEYAADNHNPKVLEFLWKATHGGQGFPEKIDIGGGEILPLIIREKKADESDDEMREVIASRPGGVSDEPDEE